jgi:hypothetical protein
MLFEEPHSYELDDTRRSLELSSAVDRRSYHVRRTVNPDGEELVHNINVGSWEDNDLAWLLPGSDSFQDGSTRQNTLGRGSVWREDTIPFPVQHDTGRRHRGWARLNPDGDEISTEEEEELERVRRARPPRTDHSNTPFIAVTRTIMTPGEEEHNVARVRLSSRYNGPAFGSAVEPRRAACPGQLPPQGPVKYGSAIPYSPNPLPMPLSEMGPQRSHKSKRPNGGTVPHTRAIWAGR